ncbi:hypothetical protein GGR50DRAFT_693418 [Xylaria sp. CBS 124048]|nr:hypothetical protein GGR50DRAFT_693418 [Xylaria sp. CBS 124048]
MPSPPEILPLTEIQFRQVSLPHVHGLFQVRTIVPDRPGSVIAVHHVQAQTEINLIANVMAETHIDSSDTKTVMTKMGYQYKDNQNFKPALIRARARQWAEALCALSGLTGYVIKALYQGQTVGVALVIRLDRNVSVLPSPMSDPTPTTSTDELNLFSPREMAAFAFCKAKDVEMSSELSRELNTCVDHYGRGLTWGLFGVGVKEEFRQNEIGRTLVQQAFSVIPSGNVIISQAMPESVGMHLAIGFKFEKSPENGRLRSVRVSPEWSPGFAMEFLMMSFKKP